VLKYQPGETLAGGLADLVPPAATAGAATAGGHPGLAALERTRVDLSRISLLRNGAVIGTYDATDLSARGDGGPALLPGDTIVLVNKPNAVRLAGDVLHPGTAYVANDESLADAIDQAGGLSPTAASANLTLLRDGAMQTLSLGDPKMQAPAHNGDVLTVPTAPRVSVVGVVEKPGPVLLKTDFSLLNALYSAGGPAKYGDLGRVSVTHNGTNTTYNVAALVKGNSTLNNPQLADGDTVFVPQGRKTDYSGIFTTLSPLLYLLRPF
jgi:protein involved in polysaccharide export with SLBB domain